MCLSICVKIHMAGVPLSKKKVYLYSSYKSAINIIIVV